MMIMMAVGISTMFETIEPIPQAIGADLGRDLRAVRLSIPVARRQL